jgi:hypothetical protein
VTAVSCAGTGSIHQALAGRRGLWVPLTWELELRPGRSFVWQAAARIARIRNLRTSEEYRAARGRLTAGKRILEGDAVDRAEYTLLWAWTAALALGTAARLTGVTWERADEFSARMLFPFGPETWESTLRFDPATGLLRTFETKRFELRAGFVRPWTLELGAYCELGAITAPTAVSMAWEGAAMTRLDLRLLTETP